MAEAERILSQNEVDALLSAIDSAAPEMGADAAAALPHDFRKPSRPTGEQLRGIQQLHEGFARKASEALSAMLRAPVDVKVAGTHALTLREALASMPSPTGLAMLTCAPGRGTALLEIGLSAAFPIVERLLGSSRVSPPGEPRPLTAVEWTVLESALGRVLDLLSESWTALSPLRFAVTARQSDPGVVGWPHPEEGAVVAVLEIVVGEQRGSLELVYPTASLEAALAALAGPGGLEGRPAGASLAERLAGAELKLTGELPGSRLRLGDARWLQAGDLILTGQPEAGPVELRVEGRPAFAGRAGRYGDRKAVRLTGRLDPSAEGVSTEATVRRAGAPGGSEIPGIEELPLTAAAVLAEKDLPLREALALRPGDRVAFPKRADEPLELRVGGRTVARGSAVRLGERFGLRLSGGP